MTRLLSDQPISNSEDDQLDSAVFARRLVGPLVQWPTADSVVMGLFAPWGYGKTSVLNLLESELNQWSDSRGRTAIPVRFNPWFYSDAETLVRSFFGTIASAIGSSDRLGKRERKRLQKAVRGFGQYVVPVLSLFPLTSSIASIAKPATKVLDRLLESGEADLRKQREKITTEMEKLSVRSSPVRVVVLIDDLDRVEDDELRLVMRMVKHVVDLPNISYVLAVDHSRVREVAAQDRSIAYGQAYLEKIIQIAVHVPQITDETLERLVKTALTDALFDGANEIEFVKPNAAVPDDIDYYRSTLGRRVHTLRDRARLVNAVRLILHVDDDAPRLHALDAVLVAFLQVFYPDAYERVRRNREFLTEGLSAGETAAAIASRIGALPNKPELRRKSLLLEIASGLRGFDYDSPDDEALKELGLTVEHVETIENTLQYLFPRAELGDYLDGQELAQGRVANRVQVPKRFALYFLTPPPADEISDAFVEDFLAQLLDLLADPKAGGDYLFAAIEVLDNALRPSFFRKVKDRLGEIDLDLAEGFAAAFYDAIRVVGDSNALEISYHLVKRLLRMGQVQASSVRTQTGERLLLSIIRKIPEPTDAILFTADVIGSRELPLQEDCRKEVVRVALDRIGEYVSEGRNVFDELGAVEAGRVIWRWRDLLRLLGREYTEIRVYLRRLVDADLRFLPDVVSLFGAWSIGEEQVPSLGDKTANEHGVSIDQVFGLPALLDAANEFISTFGEDSDVDPHGLVPQVIGIAQQLGKLGPPDEPGS